MRALPTESRHVRPTPADNPVYFSLNIPSPVVGPSDLPSTSCSANRVVGDESSKSLLRWVTVGSFGKLFFVFCIYA